MQSFTRVVFLVLSSISACARSPNANGPADESACLDAVRQPIAKEFPAATMSSCKAERVDGQDQFEVKLDNGGEKVEVDVAPDGKVLQSEVAIALDKVPPNVMAAFTAKYPTARPSSAEKQVRTGKGTYYEIAFPAESKKKEVTFTEDGTFVEEE